MKVIENLKIIASSYALTVAGAKAKGIKRCGGRKTIAWDMPPYH
jgi:hypothetical protein